MAGTDGIQRTVLKSQEHIRADTGPVLTALGKIMKFAILFIGFFSTSVYAENIAPDPWSIQPLLSGARAPEFTAKSPDGSPFYFKPGELKRPALLVFYRGGWCPYCNLHWAELRKAEEELLALDMDVLFLSADRPEILAEAYEAEKKPEYFLLSDASSQAAQAFGIAFQVDDETYDRYLQRDIVDLEESSGYSHHALPAPAVFIVDRDGLIKFQYVNPDYKVRLTPEVLVAAAKTMPDARLRRPD